MDNVRAGMMAVEYLVKKGHKRIAHMGVYDNTAGSYRMKGYIRGMQAAGFDVYDSDIIKGENTLASAIYCGSLIAEKKRDISAIYAANETLSIGLIEGIRKCGRRVPEDISIIATDNTHTSLMSNPQLTTVSCDHFKVGTEAAKLFIERCKDPNGKRKRIFFAPEIIERDSVLDLTKG
jgi:DNA-binding LacI/PurR family transcriptional regulator